MNVYLLDGHLPQAGVVAKPRVASDAALLTRYTFALMYMKLKSDSNRSGCALYSAAQICSCTAGRCAKFGHVLFVAVAYTSAILFATWMANYIDDIPTIHLDAFCKDGYMEACHIVS